MAAHQPDGAGPTSIADGRFGATPGIVAQVVAAPPSGRAAKFRQSSPLARLRQAIRGIERMAKHECVVLNPVSCAIRQAGKAAAGQTVAREPEVKLYDLRSKLPPRLRGNRNWS
jgi:hypothetical protein